MAYQMESNNYFSLSWSNTLHDIVYDTWLLVRSPIVTRHSASQVTSSSAYPMRSRALFLQKASHRVAYGGRLSHTACARLYRKRRAEGPKAHNPGSLLRSPAFFTRNV